MVPGPELTGNGGDETEDDEKEEEPEDLHVGGFIHGGALEWCRHGVLHQLRF